MTGKRVILLIALACLLYVYGYALVWGIGHALALPMPPGWRASFPTRVSGTLTWIILMHTLAVVLISLPVALLLVRFGGPRAPLVALAMTVALFVWLPLVPLDEFLGMYTPRMKVVYVFDQIKLIGVLPLLAWLIRTLPVNNVWRGP